MKKSLLILFNLLLSSNLLLFTIFMVLLPPFLFISVKIKLADPLSSLILYGLFFSVFVIIFKICIFRLIYKFKKRLPYFGNFLEKIINDLDFRKKILKITNISDTSFIFINAFLLSLYCMVKDIDFLYTGNFLRSLLLFVFWCGGVTLCYKSFLWKRK